MTTRAVRPNPHRHHHRIGLLPEPPRPANGYRVYGMHDVLRLVRAHRLTGLGPSLEEAADVLADDEGRELAEILVEIDTELDRPRVGPVHPPEVAALPADAPIENASLGDARLADLPPAQAAVVRAGIAIARPG